MRRVTPLAETTCNIVPGDDTLVTQLQADLVQRWGTLVRALGELEICVVSSNRQLAPEPLGVVATAVTAASSSGDMLVTQGALGSSGNWGDHASEAGWRSVADDRHGTHDGGQRHRV